MRDRKRKKHLREHDRRKSKRAAPSQTFYVAVAGLRSPSAHFVSQIKAMARYRPHESGDSDDRFPDRRMDWAH